jgi:hypothetical protein
MLRKTYIINSDIDSDIDNEINSEIDSEIINLNNRSKGTRLCYTFVWLSSCTISFLGGYLVRQQYFNICDGSL